ncbi:hypothetical protein EYF80_024008 [Liparis tanakae]|uniref:Uncharacterized protein n=1 Tax=Liparis tanakae TaxID=230148 RepID=A0A4Z2HKA4_9TELE|nr:hypothetical protein EYF80_024008 [Liparis tanakae]
MQSRSAVNRGTTSGALPSSTTPEPESTTRTGRTTVSTSVSEAVNLNTTPHSALKEHLWDLVSRGLPSWTYFTSSSRKLQSNTCRPPDPNSCKTTGLVLSMCNGGPTGGVSSPAGSLSVTNTERPRATSTPEFTSTRPPPRTDVAAASRSSSHPNKAAVTAAMLDRREVLEVAWDQGGAGGGEQGEGGGVGGVFSGSKQGTNWNRPGLQQRGVNVGCEEKLCSWLEEELILRVKGRRSGSVHGGLVANRVPTEVCTGLILSDFLQDPTRWYQ